MRGKGKGPGGLSGQGGGPHQGEGARSRPVQGTQGAEPRFAFPRKRVHGVPEAQTAAC